MRETASKLSAEIAAATIPLRGSHLTLSLEPYLKTSKYTPTLN
jgi:hypothetical protein